MPTPPSTRPSGARGRRSSAFVRNCSNDLPGSRTAKPLRGRRLRHEAQLGEQRHLVVVEVPTESSPLMTYPHLQLIRYATPASKVDAGVTRPAVLGCADAFHSG